jgi:hypothetical protein
MLKMRSMDIPSEARAIETQLKAAGITIQSVLNSASLDRSTWTRWKKGAFTPRLSSWLALQREADRMLAERKIRG